MMRCAVVVALLLFAHPLSAAEPAPPPRDVSEVCQPGDLRCKARAVLSLTTADPKREKAREALAASDPKRVQAKAALAAPPK